MFFRREKAPPPPAFTLDVSVVTDAGCVRDLNEDQGRFVRPGTPTLLRQKGALALVADGMGGHAAGEVASQMAAEVVTRHYFASPDAPAAALSRAVAEANRVLFDTARQDAALQGMGTTCSALVLCGHEAFCAHVGDSRIYLLRNGSLQQLTEDHSVVNEMRRRGLLSDAEARHHADRNVITRALGLHPEVQVDSWTRPLALQPDDTFVLCSDGLHDVVEDEELHGVASAGPAQAAAQRLVELAKARGGPDNITVALIRLVAYDGAPTPRARDTRELKGLP